MQNNPALELLDLPALRSVGANVCVAGNRSLPTSQVEDLVAGICPDRIGGSVNIVGNAVD